jgi:hypothetical protein
VPQPTTLPRFPHACGVLYGNRTPVLSGGSDNGMTFHYNGETLMRQWERERERERESARATKRDVLTDRDESWSIYCCRGCEHARKSSRYVLLIHHPSQRLSWYTSLDREDSRLSVRKWKQRTLLLAAVGRRSEAYPVYKLWNRIC